ncbi:hypothetical protein F4802DRAFT_618481 [Xylaria palmicola]|nr:hypothetical protein F4802DRAFT_618481 [Xylaria palmicola]
MAASRKATLVVGIDFGTTYSGVSWFVCNGSSPPGQLEVVTLWQTSTDNRWGNSDSYKVPSKMHYDNNGELSWGFRTPTGAETIEWFKLLLLNHEHLQDYLKDSHPSHLIHTVKLAQGLGKSCVQLVGEYLEVLWNHTLEQIRKAKGEIIEGMPFQVILTVPAIWPDDARNRMRDAARMAGIFNYRLAGETTLEFLAEPEAAAIATLPELDNRGDLRIGDSFVVVDAGGGTVDIISYKINGLEPLLVSECVEGDALCGGAFLDNEFEMFLKCFVGEESWSMMSESDIRRMMNNEWEHGIKKAFHGEPDYYTVELPNSVQHAPMKFSSNELQPVFDKIVARINVLVQGQIINIKQKTSQLPRLVILVGGFGQSPYILKFLKERLDGRITILQLPGRQSWTAVCRGAALSGAWRLGSITREEQSPVQSRIARLSYGWTMSVNFIHGFHDPRDLYWCRVRKEWLAANQMQWVIKRGDDISLKMPKTYAYNIVYNAKDQGRGIFEDAVYTCQDANPPSRRTDDVHKLSEFTLHTPKALQKYKKVSNKGNSYRIWVYEVKVSVCGSSFEVTLVSEGVEQKIEKIFVDTD